MYKVFISYYHKQDQQYKDILIDLNNQYRMFIDNSVDMGDIDDENMTDEQIRVKIRDEYIKDTDVFILLCGRNSKHRKHIDWEIHAAMYRSEIKNPIPIIVINLPQCRNTERKNNEGEKRIIEKNGPTNWTSFNSYSEYKENYPDLPERILKSLANKKACISIINWDVLDINDIKELINYAYQRRKEYEYDDSDKLRRKNGEDDII